MTRAQLAQALRECEQDLEASQRQVEILQTALTNTDTLLEQRKALSDSLISNLKEQLSLQDSVTLMFKINSDTLQLMLVDYRQKLEQVNQLYVQELKKQTRPWFLSGNGLKGLSYGVFVGAALGLVFGLAR